VLTLILRILVPSCLVICLFTLGCGGSDKEGDSGVTATATEALPPPAVDRSAFPLKVVVSLPIFADMAQIMGGDQVTVTTLIPAGENPHEYVPSDDLADEVGAADLIFYNASDFEGPTERFITEHLAPRPPLVIDMIRDVPSPSADQPVDRPIYAKDVGDDPHLFLDPLLAQSNAETISHSMIIVDGANTAFYDARFIAYKNQLGGLDQTTRETLGSIPEANRTVVTQHNSLVWYAKRYGLTVAGTMDDDGEEGLREKLQQSRPPAVFSESGFDSEALTSIASELGIRVCDIDTDNVSDEDTSYLEMMEALASKISECLGGS